MSRGAASGPTSLPQVQKVGWPQSPARSPHLGPLQGPTSLAHHQLTQTVTGTVFTVCLGDHGTWKPDCGTRTGHYRTRARNIK